MPRIRTKIVATLGPASDNEDTIRQLIEAGVSAFRLNFSHGTHTTHARTIRRIKKIREAMKVPVAILQDLSGPKIRVGDLTTGPIQLKEGETVILNASLSRSDGDEIPVTYNGFAEDVRKGGRLLLADGALELKIQKVEPPRVYCKVIVGGTLSSRKGINYPEGSFSLPAVTEKDKDDLRFGLKHGVDAVALSFVRTQEDIKTARELCAEMGKSVLLFAKIEKHEAVRNFLDILQEVDGVMVARGDLGVEIPLEEVPIVQKRIIHMCNLHGKPVITATQMLLSMVHAPRPTRAEVTDVANAILDGTDAIMLSDETAMGQYPIKAVQTMKQIARFTERNFKSYYRQDTWNMAITEGRRIPESISQNVAELSEEINANVIICPTTSGFTARMISRKRPNAHVLALTPIKKNVYLLAFLWGVIPEYLPYRKHTRTLFKTALHIAHQKGLLDEGDSYVITAGYPFGTGKTTNLIKAGVFNDLEGI